MMRSAADWLSQSGTSSPSLVITDAVYKLIKGAGGLSQLSKSEAGLQACNPGLATLLATLQGRISSEALRDGQLRFRYPESAKHPHQAYVAPEDKRND